MLTKALASATLVIAGVGVYWISSRAEPTVRVSAWQPFSGVFRIADATGNTTARGKYWRSADGSDRREITSDLPGKSGIQIRSIPERTCYRFKPDTGWTAQPMLLPAAGWLPPPPRRLENASTVIVSGFEGRRVSSPRGDYAVFAPRLNDFCLVKFTVASGRREEYVSIVLGEPDPNLFRVPAGTRLTQMSQPAGILARPRRGSATRSDDP